MGPPTLEIAGRSQREQKSKDGTLSSSEAPPFPPTSTESTATDPSFKLPKIQRDRKPEYSKPPSDDDEEEGALPPSADPSNSHFASSPQPDPAPPSHSGRALDYETRASWSKEDSRFSPSKPVPEVANGQATSASSEVRGYHPRVSRSPEFSRKVPRLDEGTGGLGRRDYRDYHETRALARGVDRSWDRDERERERGAPYPERRRSPVDPFDPAPPRLDAWHSSRYPRDPDPRGALYKKADDATRDKERALLGRNGASYVPLSPPRRSYQPRSPSPFSESSSRRSQGREWDDPVRLAAAPPSYSSSRDRGRDYDRSWGVRERAARAYSPRSEREREHYYRSAEPLYRGGERDARERKRSRSPVSTRAYKEDAERSHHDYHQRPSSRSPSRSVYARALPRESSPPPLPASRRSTGGAHRLSSRSRSPPPVTLKRKANFASLTESQRLAAIQAKVDLPADSDKSEPQPKPENGSSDPTISDVGNASSSRTAADASIQSSSIATAPVPGPAPPAAYDVVSGDPSLNGKPSESSTVSEKGKVIIADSSSQTASSTPPVATKSKVATLVESTPRKRARRSGPSRRRERPTLVPLSERKFYGCSSLDDYEITIKLGQGTFGEVKKGRHIATGIEVALKKVTIHDEKDGMPITALREVKLLKRLCHPSIVPVIDMAYRPSGERGKLGDVYMVEPYMDHDLNGMLENPNIDLKVPQIKLYMKQLLEGTLFLHKNKILHRDMKAANLLINNEGQLQIADFGLARPFHDPGQAWKSKGWQGGVNKYTNMVVTRWYRPPELLAGEKKYGPPIDMWGVGCILAEMVTGKPIFKGTSEINQLELISQLCGSPNEENFPGWSQLPGVKDADPSGRPDPYPEVPGRHEFGNYQRSVRLYFTSTVDA
ncbi:Pkinase-domain-containing protein [Violaceomyces palustris]|uniref:Pkinase-domain-containing protein n=1 Tax=Violaceomyces palustris TaxID=1673888 RepID=A0ACD0NMM4_9BASI|nr:Pkinase-domain-containing protein [Violaceomyces palustris]